MDEAQRAALAAFLADRRGSPVVILDVQRINVGHSRAMYRIELDDGSRYVVRLEQGGVFGTSSHEEYGVMAALAEVGVPVARVRWMEPSGAVLGQPFFVMDLLVEAVDNESRTLDPATTDAFVSALDRLHRVDWQAARIPFQLIPDDPAQATHGQIERWAGAYRRAAAGPIPLLEEAAAWLHAHAPPLQHLAVVHGDAGPGNFVHHQGRIVAITDWEFAHLGDPAEDWSFCMTMRGRDTFDPPGWRDVFARVAGVELDDAAWAYWEAFNLFKGACANRTCLTVFEEGASRAPDLVVIGTMLHRVFLRRLVDIVARPPATGGPRD